MKVVCVIQARIGSTRLPGKVMMNLDGHPVLEWCERACEAAPGIDEVWVATSNLPADDQIYDWCYENVTYCWRGSETDVLSRFVGCAEASSADVVLRITGDEPFVDPQVIGAVVRLQKQTGAAFVTNVSPRTYPDGLDVQCFTMEALLAAHEEATRPFDRDGVCTWIERNRSRFPAQTIINPIPGMERERWVLDTKEDYTFCKAVVEIWPWSKGPPSQLDILNVLDYAPHLRLINGHHIMNERAFEALAEEPLYERTFERSQEFSKNVRKVVPLGAQTFSKSYVQYPQPSPLFLSHGQGGLVWDVDGNEYVDMVGALLPNILGYRDPDVDAAIRKQLGSGISFSLATELEYELTATLCHLIQCAEMARFFKTGSESTSAAIRIARAVTGRSHVLMCGYHGWHDWSIGQSHMDSGLRGVPVEVLDLTTHIQVGDHVRLPETVAAIIVDCSIADPTWLQYLRNICTMFGTVLIFDEMITGFRYDLGGAQKLWDVTPDLACFGKSMANGMPLAAVVGRRELMKKFEPPDNVFVSGTFGGETLSLAAAIATISKLEREDVIPALWSRGQDLRRSVINLLDLHDSHDSITMHGYQPFVRLKFKDEKIEALFRREMVKTGVLITSSHNICAAHGPNEIKRVLKSYDHALGIIAESLRKGAIDEAPLATGVRP